MVYRRKANIIYKAFDDEILLFDLQKNVPYILNGAAFFIFSRTDAGLDREDIAEKMSLEFQVSYDRALGDINGLLEELIDKGIIQHMA